MSAIPHFVIACDKRDAFAQGSDGDVERDYLNPTDTFPRAPKSTAQKSPD
jgi:hypothetical protein